MIDIVKRPGPPGLELRAARTGDTEALAAMMSLPGYCWGTAQTPFPTLEQVRSRIEKLAPNTPHLVALVDAELVGSASLQRFTGRRAHSAGIGIGVHDAWVGRGIGTTLMAALIDLADNWMALGRLELTVNVDNLPALALYRRFGFEVEGTHRAHIFRGGEFVDGHTMARLNERLRKPTEAAAE
ncbi:GNAT family N-acetyltransferase [Lichenicoccus sp.]|uniref:GNAT family N-acetyltransferase n=1 Tax=Lichenicoccus sp. TaxID=2781899 RepID=UPI003D0FAB60